jgi:plasmid replication initiation protein
MANGAVSANGRQLQSIRDQREEKVYKANKIMQNARYDLNLKEQKVILYAISKIKKGDDYTTPYIFDIQELNRICGIKKESYTEIKALLKGLRDRSWYEIIPDPINGGMTESTFAWFSKVRPNEKGGKVTIKFDEDMMPYLFDLLKKYEEYGEYYSQYALRIILPMRSKYGIRLYELLKSYSNNDVWGFELDSLRRRLDCAEKYKLFADFERRVLIPAVKDINEFSDLEVSYETDKVHFSKTDYVEFSIKQRKNGSREHFEAIHAGQLALDGMEW